MASFRDIIGYYRRYWPTSIFSITASGIFQLIDLLVPYAIGQVLNVLSGQSLDAPVRSAIYAIEHTLANAKITFLSGQSPNQSLSLWVLLGLIFLVTVVRAPAEPWLSDWFHWDISLRARRDHSQKVLAKILTLPLEFYDENNPGRIASRVAKGLANHTWTYPEIAGILIPKLIRIFGIFLITWYIDWQIALFILASFVFILSYTFKTLKYLMKREQRLDKYTEEIESRNSEIITNIKTVKAYATEVEELNRIRERLDRELKVIINRIHRGYTTLSTWQKTNVQFCLFLVLSFTLAATARGQISLGHFVTTYTVASMAYAEVTPISQLAEVFARRYASMMRFHELMNLSAGVEATELVKTLNDIESSHHLKSSHLKSSHHFSIKPYKFTGKLEFHELTFGYDPQRPVLQDINLFIEPCQTVALVGRSGSGKSTLVKLLYRYFEPNSGRILIDGQDIRTLEVTSYRRRLGIVHQEVDIFNGTLLDNLTYGNRQVTFEEVEKACGIARLDEVIEHLPQGYYTVVGERGMRLSGGQKQRLGIARSLLVDPDVLIFDEATSSLDYESERAIQLAMRSILGTRTTMIIAHRLSTIREADKIVVLDRGRILEIGSHEELLRSQGIYRRLHSLQETGDIL